MHLFTPNHVALVGACYPPWSSASPEYRPNPQELSRLTYYATNRPGKIHKLGLELEKHTRSESTKALAGHPRQRACVSSLSPSLHPHTRPAPSSSHSPSSVPSPSNVAATSPSFPPPSFPASNSPSISSPPTWRSLPVLPASCVASPPPLTTPHPFSAHRMVHLHRRSCHRRRSRHDPKLPRRARSICKAVRRRDKIRRPRAQKQVSLPIPFHPLPIPSPGLVSSAWLQSPA